jgi:hypothetical protein
MRKLRKLNRREKQNILELEINKIMADGAVEKNGQLFILKAFNSPSPRSFSFLNPALLDSQNRNPVTP